MGVDVRAAVAATLLAVCLSGCTPDPVVTPTPTPASQSPTETEQEREQRVAYEAAEKSYREFRAEFREITGKGGASSASPKMKATAAGPYLAEFTKIIRAYKNVDLYTTGETSVRNVTPSGYSADSLILKLCEDERDVLTFDKSKNRVAKNSELALTLDVRRIDGDWKVWSQKSGSANICD